MEHYHHVVVLGIKESGYIDVIRLFRVAKSTSFDTLEQDINTIIHELEPYKPDLILPDIGYSGNYVEKLQVFFGLSRVYGVNVRSALTNNDLKAHFNESDNTVTIDKLMQNLLLLSSLHRGDFKFYKPLDSQEKLFIEHGLNLLIRGEDVTDPQTKLPKTVLKISRKGDDHYFQAMVYAMVAMRRIIEERTRHEVKVDSIDFHMEGTDLQEHLGISQPYALK